ncbi:MAG: 4-phosphoerythronate dehydrogenase [Gammaproteobacteria bacterium]
MPIKIIADRNIPQVEKAFAHIGEVELVDGRQLCADQLYDTQILVVRSVTQVNQALLQDSPVRFVGSATIGTDHVDLDYLQQRGIVFRNAPGCNAVSAAEYVVAALLNFTRRHQVLLEGLVVGIVGYGNVGSRVAARLSALGCEIRAYDPPRQQQFNDRDYVSWDQIQAADVVTAHVPLTKAGDYPTYQMFNQGFFSGLRDDALFINTSRGWAVDELALKQVLATGKPLNLILDVWQNEPTIDLELLAQTHIATPHIAGYSAEGKHRGLETIYHAACEFLGYQPQWSLAEALPPHSFVIEPNLQLDDLSLVHSLVTQAYDIERDDRALRKVCELPEAERGAGFDGLRKHYPVRREFAYHRVMLPRQRDKLANCLSRLGFTILHTAGPANA